MGVATWAPRTATISEGNSTSDVHDPLSPGPVVDTLGPTHPVVLKSGNRVSERAHTVTRDDEGAPAPAEGAGPWLLPTSVVSSAQTFGRAHDGDTRYHRWNQPTVVTETSGGAAHTTTDYDPAGRLVRTAVATSGLTGSNPSRRHTRTCALSKGISTK